MNSHRDFSMKQLTWHLNYCSMDLYIDKKNLTSLIKSRSEDIYEDCVKLMRKQFDINFNFPKEELKSDENLMLWFRKNFTQGVEESEITFGDPFPEKPLKSNSTSTFNSRQLSSVYLLEDESVSKLKNTGSVMIGEVGEEIETLHKLFFQQGDYLFDKTWKIGADSFNKWADLEPFSLPLTDIVIVDPYVLRSMDDCKINLIPYLKSLVKNTKTKIDVVIYTNREDCLEYSEIAPLIKKGIKQVTGVKPHLTVITYTDRRGVPSRGEHDRTILMNYKRIKSGDTFNYFKADGSIKTKGREIQYLSLARRENFDLAQELLKDLQDHIDFFKKNNTNIEGDGKSHFLNFN